LRTWLCPQLRSVGEIFPVVISLTPMFPRPLPAPATPQLSTSPSNLHPSLYCFRRCPNYPPHFNTRKPTIKLPCTALGSIPRLPRKHHISVLGFFRADYIQPGSPPPTTRDSNNPHISPPSPTSILLEDVNNLLGRKTVRDRVPSSATDYLL
jgi:hypothetical protein